jgi:HSP20 family protein
MERHNSGREIDGQRNSAPENAEALDPLVELHELQRRLDALVARLMGRSGVVARLPRAEVEPEMDIFENDDEFLIEAAVPGVPADKIHIDVTSHTITLSAETLHSRTGDSDRSSAVKRHRRSRYSDHERYYCVYTLDAAIIPGAVRAFFRHGIVDIRLPKVHTAPLSVSVPILLQGNTPHHIPTRLENVLSVEAVVITAREGSPGQKLGAAYVSNAGEDHTAKAQSTGERPSPARAAAPLADRLRTAENVGADTLQPTAGDLGQKH